MLRELHARWAVLSVSVLLGCQPDVSPKAARSVSTAPPLPSVPSVPNVPTVPADAPAFCGRAGDDPVRDVFCAEAPAAITGLAELQDRVGLGFSDPDAGYSSGSGLDFRAVFLAHSTALSGRMVSSINPRAIVVGYNALMAFNRGVQQVELIVPDRHTYHLSLYLVSFEQACNAAPGGCSPGDLFTPRIESDWTRVTIEESEELKDTPSDCRQCHQRGLHAPITLMRELDGPWTHFFAPNQGDGNALPEPSGVELVRDYLAAKGDEPYAAVPSSVLTDTIGLALQDSVNLPQPIVFDGATIMSERWHYDPETGYSTTPTRSATWDSTYEAFKRGENLPLPYFAPRPTDPDKLATLTAAYQSYRRGDMTAEELPDFSDVFPDDPQVRAEIGLQTEPGATPAETLVQGCGTCHNDVLDQNISRARFNIDLARMDRAELDVAIARLQAPRDGAGSMPPPGRRQLDAGSVDDLIAYLKRNVRSADDDALLGRAARLGMAGTIEPAPDLPPPTP